ncbi:MAG: hypothetical protein ACE5I5_08030 [Candidatus Heimdallarchaeota archaeon]
MGNIFQQPLARLYELKAWDLAVFRTTGYNLLEEFWRLGFQQTGRLKTPERSGWCNLSSIYAIVTGQDGTNWPHSLLY